MLFIVNRFLLRKGFNGITIWPFIIARKKHFKEDTVFLNHEKIHLRQQAELLVLPFYLWYCLEFLVRLFQYKNRHLAYKNISFEREAYFEEMNLTYLKERSFWAFVKFIRIKKEDDI